MNFLVIHCTTFHYTNIGFVLVLNSPGSTGSHMITTVNCHSSFRFPPQHTLRARGVCSRIPHLRHFRRATHGQITTHVYLLHIIPFLGCLRLSVVVVSIDLHSSKPCFSVQFVDTYSIHSFPPPSRRAQQIQPFPQCGAGVSPPATKGSLTAFSKP